MALMMTSIKIINQYTYNIYRIVGCIIEFGSCLPLAKHMIPTYLGLLSHSKRSYLPLLNTAGSLADLDCRDVGFS